MKLRSLLVCVLGVAVLWTTGCGPTAALTDLKVTEVFSGYYELGVVNARTKFVPSIQFKLQNAGSAPIDHVQLIVSYWAKGDDGELDSKEVTGIGAEALAPGATGNIVLARSDTGFTLEGARADFFTNSRYRDFTAKLFAKRGGKIVPIGEFPIDRQLLPHTDSPGQ